MILFGLAVSAAFIAIGVAFLRFGLRIMREQVYVGKRRVRLETVSYSLTGERAVAMGRAFVAGAIVMIVTFSLAAFLALNEVGAAGYVVCISPLGIVIMVVGAVRAHRGLEITGEEDEIR